MVYKLYFSDKCPDTPAFVTKLKDLGVDYQEVNITVSMINLKAFLACRDKFKAFDEPKEAGQLGVPCLQVAPDHFILSLADLQEYFT